MLHEKLHLHARVPRIAIASMALALTASSSIALTARHNQLAMKPTAKIAAIRPTKKKHHHKLSVAALARFKAHALTPHITAATPTTTPVTVAPTLPTTPPTAAPEVTTPPAGTPSVSPGTQMLFDDEFDGGSLDLSKWQPNWLGSSNSSITKPINSAEVSCYDPSQVSVSGGSLHLSAEARSCTDEGGNKYSYASGLVETAGHFTFTYGHMEARVWLPGNGAATNWPAFWADGTGTWPVTGELDVMEGLSGNDCYHFHSPSGGPGGCASLSTASGWHVFAADWAPGSVTYSYDGNVVGTITSGITTAPMYLILNLGVGGYGGAIEAPSTMLVDYVRVWKT
jgi:beta-glucanase (GH16 family)